MVHIQRIDEVISVRTNLNISVMYTVLFFSVRFDIKYISALHVDHRLWISADKCMHIRSKQLNLMVHIQCTDIYLSVRIYEF